MEIIPQGDWIVVTRKVSDTSSRGRIIGYYKHWADAGRDARLLRERKPEWQVWVMPRADY